MHGQRAGPCRGLEAPRSQSKSTGNKCELTWQVNPRNGQVIKQSTQGCVASGRAHELQSTQVNRAVNADDSGLDTRDDGEKVEGEAQESGRRAWKQAGG